MQMLSNLVKTGVSRKIIIKTNPANKNAYLFIGVMGETELKIDQFLLNCFY